MRACRTPSYVHGEKKNVCVCVYLKKQRKTYFMHNKSGLECMAYTYICIHIHLHKCPHTHAAHAHRSICPVTGCGYPGAPGGTYLSPAPTSAGGRGTPAHVQSLHECCAHVCACMENGGDTPPNGWCAHVCKSPHISICMRVCMYAVTIETFPTRNVLRGTVCTNIRLCTIPTPLKDQGTNDAMRNQTHKLMDAISDLAVE